MDSIPLDPQEHGRIQSLFYFCFKDEGWVQGIEMIYTGYIVERKSLD